MISTDFDERVALSLFAAFLVSLVATPLVRDFAKRRSLLDSPNHRSSHVVPVPRLGGVAIVLATGIGAAVLVDRFDSRIALVAIGGLVIALAGFVDDLRSINALQKYTFQVVPAGIGAWALRPDLTVDILGSDFVITGWVSILLSAFWITAFTNAFNFMDGVDGLAGGAGMLSAAGLALLASGASLFFLLPLAAGLAGFLVWNMNPASIFMGDGGSQFVGYALAMGALWWPSFEVPVVPVLLLFAPFLFDTGFTLVWRLWKRQNVFQGHRSHLYQRMTSIGYSHREVMAVYLAWTAICVLFAAAYPLAGAAVQGGVLLAAIALALVYVAWITRHEILSEASPKAPYIRSQRGRTNP